MKEEWAKGLEQKMAGFEQPVDDALWAGIARASGAAGIRWWPWAATALAFAAVTTVVLLLRPEPVVEPAFVVGSEKIVATVEEEPITEAPDKNDTPVSHSRPVRLAQNIVARPRIETEESFPPKDAEEKTNGDQFTERDTITQEEYSAANADEPAEDEWVRIIDEEPAPRRNRVKIATSFYAQASPLGNRYSAGQAQYGDPDLPPDDNTVDNPGSGANASGPPEDSDEDNTQTKASGRYMKTAKTQSATTYPGWTHAFPVQIGARVSLSWSERWSIDTGLTFMHFKSWNAGTQQRMEFLGIPLYVDYQIGSARNFSFYASAGGQALKCFAGNAPDKPWLFSCGLGLGAEYCFSPLVSMYAEPGADWYFHTGESCHYYTDNPFAFSLSLGIRLHF